MLTDRSRTAIFAHRHFGRSTLSRTALACSSLAIAVALTSAPSRAQSFLASSTTTFGNAVVTTGPNTTTITISSPSAVIDWTPTDTATSPLGITYQPNGTTATFTSASNFTVLNRIIPVDPTRLIAFDGIVNSLVNGSPGGTVFFYSPGGIVLSINSQFNVGNLGLTSSAPVVDGAGNWYVGNQVQFQASDAGRAVNTLLGSQINAPAANSFVALVAPSVSHRGAITVNGQAALVSADAATITFAPSGLFDIQVTSGTSATGSTLFNSGIITGPASSGTGDNHRVYAVAVPKNTAITLAISSGSSLGFDIAGAADVVGNAVVLSAGRDIVGGNISTVPSAGGGTGLANLNIANTAVTSSLRGSSTNDTFFFSTTGQTASAASSVNLIGPSQAKLSADGTGAVTTVTGGVNLNANATVTVGGANATAGTAEIFAINNGQVTVGGAFLNASGFGGGTIASGGTGGVGTGGIAIIQATSGGDVLINGAGQVIATGTGGANTSTGGGNGGVGQGGRAQIFARDAGSSVQINGIVNAIAAATGGASGVTGQGGAGVGGIALINAQAAGPATVTIGGVTNIGTAGTGGGGFVGGAGTGGTSTAAASVGNTVSFNQSVAIIAAGLGGNGTQAGGIGTGGAARLTLFQTGTINVATDATLNASGISGTGGVGTGANVGGIASAVAQQNSVLDINGALVVNASGFGLSVTGRGSNGGSAVVGATGNSRVDVAGVMRVFAYGTAGNALGTTGAGGNGLGGNAQVFVNTGGDVLANELNVAADGVGGADVGSGAGSGTGGAASIFAGDAGSTITIANGNSTGVFMNGDLDFLSAEGFGGVSNGGGSGLGGNATGGAASITANNGAVLNGPATVGSQGFVRIIARATAGNANTGAIAGGSATSGSINITVDNATMTSAGLLPSIFALGGSATTAATGNIAGGNAVGGNRSINVFNGGNLTTAFGGGSAGASGGNGRGSGRGGDGSGGNATLLVDTGSTLTLTGSSLLFTQNGGGTGGATGTNGNSSGGNAFARVANGSTLSMAGPATNSFSVSTDAFGSFITPQPSPAGSNASAGTATFVIENATVNLQTLRVSAVGNGGGGMVAQGGNGTGGSATLQLIGATLTADTVLVDAGGNGGSLDPGQSGVAGNGVGGTARFIATGGTNTATIAQFAGVGAEGGGGNIGGAAGTATGNGTGGFALLLVNGGASLALTAPEVFVGADGEGGEAVGPSNFGGDGIGGQAEVFVNGGNLTINGSLSLEADNDGGEGLLGGDGLRRADGSPNALLRAQNGNITVTGVTRLASVGEGSSGGSANGGRVIIDAQNSLAGPGTITLNQLLADVSAVGGAGSNTPSFTQLESEGGDAFGGNIQILGSAGNGVLIVNGTSFLNSQAFGGAGATGLPGAPGAAGEAGTRGGDAVGGFIQFGTKSGSLDTGSINTGSARFGAVTAVANALGGAGGLGGSGTTQGVGGAGGDAQGGAVTLLVRGSPVTLTGIATLSGDATGGKGGTGSTEGAGGDATVGNAGGVAILATSRFMQPTQRGTLTAGDIAGSASAIGGAGSTMGASFAGDLPLQLEFSSASGSVGSITLVAEADNMSVALPSRILLTDGMLNIARGLSLSTPGSLSVTLDRFTVNVANLSLEAGNFVLAATRPATLGTINVSGGLTISSLLDFLAYANFNVAGSGAFDVDGSVLTGDLTFGGPLDIDALGSITTGNVQVVGDLHLRAGGAIQSGALTASQSVDLSSNGTVTTGALVAGDSVGVEAIGAVNIASASAGIVNPSSISGAEYVVALRSLASITAGNLSARGSVGVASPGSIAVGNVTTGSSGLGFLALAGTGLTTGSIDTTASPNGGQVYLANFSMEALGGQITRTFDPAPILAATPVAVGGPITINGAVNTRLLRAASTQGYTSGAITTSDSVSIDVTGPITLTGAVTAGRSVFLVSRSGAVSGQAITAGNAIGLSGLGSITVGNLSAGVVNRSTATGANYQIQLGSGASVATGSILTTGQALLRSLGTLTSGAITARDILVLASTGIATGALSTGSIDPVTLAVTRSGRILLADRSMTGVPASFAAFDPEPIFAATPIAMSGPISTGAVSTDTFRASATGTVAVGNVTSLNTLLNGVAGVSTGTVTAGQSASLFSSAGGVSAGAIQAGDSISVNALGAVTLGNITAGLDIALTTSGALSGGNLTAGDAIVATAAGAVTLGNLSAGLVNPSTATGATRGVGVRSTGGRVTVGTVSASRDVILVAGGGNLEVGSVLTDSSAVFLARDAATTGSITAGNAGQIYIGNASMSAQAGANDSINPAIFNAAPIPLSGAIGIGGTVRGGTFTAAANGNFTAADLTLGQRITLGRGATALVNGAWTAPTISLASQRLQFGTSTSAGIGGSGTTSLTLRALASGQTVVLGGTTAGMGYTLSQSDFGRIRAGNLTLRVDPQGVSSTAPDLEIRDLTLNGSAGGGFATTTIATNGRARVTGDLLLQQAGAMDTLTLSANQKLEIVLPDASIAITGAGGALAGTLTVSSDNLVAGTLDLLMRVMEDPDASGLVDAFKAPASTTPNLAGYIRADGVKLLSNANILLQNSGTARDFAGVTVGGGGLIVGRITPATTGGTTGGGTTTSTGFSFTGMLVTANDVLMFQFRVDANSSVTLRTYSYAGGTNQAGEVIPAGGFDPILALFDAAGALIGQNDDGGSNVPADPTTGSRFDTFFQPSTPLAPGNYTVSVSVFSNFAIGPNLSNGFEMSETSFGTGRTANFAFDVLGAATATGPGSMTTTSSGPLNVIGFGRQTTATGSTTGNAFFSGINFGTSGETPLVYSELSQFNTCLVSGGCSASLPEIDPVSSISSEVRLAIVNQLADAPVPGVIEEAADSATESADEEAAQSAEEEDEAEADEASSPIAPPAPLINTRSLNPAVNVVEPVAGSGNPALIGSAVNEATAQGDTP